MPNDFNRVESPKDLELERYLAEDRDAKSQKVIVNNTFRPI